MSSLPQLSESAISAWTDSGSFGRGQRYYETGHIINPRRQGETLKALCLGSRPQPYRVEIVLGQEGIVSGDCSCPIGTGGHCKHAVALLLTWLHEPETFMTVEDLETALDRLSKAELIVLIRRMLDRYPDLEPLLDLPIVGDAKEAPPANAEAIRRQAQGAFAGFDYDDWGAIHSIVQRLLELVDIGDDYLRIERWRDAAAVYQAVMKETLNGYGTARDESGDLHEVVNRCVDGLGACLTETEEPLRRRMLLKALFDVYRWDVNFGGIDMGYQAPHIILEEATPDEKREVSEWVRDVLPQKRSWSKRAYGHFLLRLEEDWLDDEAFLRICRETERREELVERLLTLDRIDEAIAASREASDYGLLQLADIFVAQGHGDLAEELIRERSPDDRDIRLTAWLKDRTLERGDREEALALAEEVFWRRPTLQRYQELSALAQLMDRSDDLRTALLARLVEEGKYRLLIKIHLDEGEVDQALETLEQRKAASQWGWRTDRLVLQVAQAAEEEQPREAIRLYVQAAEQLIAQRGRNNYAKAATHLTRVRDLYQGLNKPSRWEAFIAELREKNRRLPALQNELNKAGL